MLNDYVCKKCKYFFDSFKEGPCPKCGSKKVEKKVSWNGTFFIKGSNSASTPRSKKK